jgi:hypothetical protein
MKHSRVALTFKASSSSLSQLRLAKQRQYATQNVSTRLIIFHRTFRQFFPAQLLVNDDRFSLHTDSMTLLWGGQQLLLILGCFRKVWKSLVLLRGAHTFELTANLIITHKSGISRHGSK